jgi:hypothetical protein
MSSEQKNATQIITTEDKKIIEDFLFTFLRCRYDLNATAVLCTVLFSLTPDACPLQRGAASTSTQCVRRRRDLLCCAFTLFEDLEKVQRGAGWVLY